MTWTKGSSSNSETLTDDDDLYPTHINQLRESNPASAVVGTTTNCQYVCDGTADDVQIQAAIDAVNTAGGGIVHIKPGTYDQSAVINLKTGVHLRGEGEITKLSFTGTGDAVAAITIPDGQSNCSIKDLWLYNGVADTTAYYTYGIKVKHSSRVTIDKCRVEKFGASGIMVLSGDLTPEHYCEDVWVTNNYVKDNGRQAIGGGSAEDGIAIVECKNAYVLNNTVDDYSLRGINLEGYWLENIIVEENNITCTTRLASQFIGAAIQLATVDKGGADNEVCRNITIKNNNIHDIDISNTYFNNSGNAYRIGVIHVSCSPLTNEQRNIEISDNKIWNCNGYYNAGIYVGGVGFVGNIKMTGNQIDTITSVGGVGGHGIWIGGGSSLPSSKSIIMGNMIKNTDGSGIYLDAIPVTGYITDVSNTMVANNMILSATTYGINIGGGTAATSCLVIGNVVVDAGTAILNNGTTTLIRSNIGITDS